MDAFSYLSVLLSIILGLALTQLLQSVGRLIQARERVRFYSVPLILAGILLVSFIQSWWAMFGLRNRQGWDFLGFLVVILQVVFAYLQAAMILPEVGEGPVVLRESYFAQRRWFFAFVIGGTMMSLLKDVVLDGHLPPAEQLLAFLSANLLFAYLAIVLFRRAEPALLERL